jgi:hypothetical protein
MTNSDKNEKGIMEMKIFSMFTLDDLGIQMVEFQETFILTVKFMELRREVEMLRHIPRAEHIRKYCSIFQEQNAIRNVAACSKSRMQ